MRRERIPCSPSNAATPPRAALCGPLDCLQASYVILILGYLDTAFGGLSDLVLYAIAIFTLALAIGVNMFGLDALGSVDEVMIFLILLPFAIVFVWGLPTMHPEYLSERLPSASMHWGVFTSNVIWDMLGFASAGTVAGEVKDPGRTYPRAMVLAIILLVLNYEVRSCVVRSLVVCSRCC